MGAQYSPPIIKIVTVKVKILVTADVHDHLTVLWLSAAQPRARQSIRRWTERMVELGGIWRTSVNIYLVCGLYKCEDTFKVERAGEV